jgi:hypothetical protein
MVDGVCRIFAELDPLGARVMKLEFLRQTDLDKVV